MKIPLGDENFSLVIDEFVANPKIMNSGIQIVEYLVKHPHLIKDKIVMDMGTGSGIIGIASTMLGAKKVFMLDIDTRSINNATNNIKTLKLRQCEVIESDLFNNFRNKEKIDTHIFNHPFFSNEPITNKDWTRMMLGGSNLIARYFEQAPQYSNKDAIYILPWLTLANNKNGIDNDPNKRAPKYGYKIIDTSYQFATKQGLQHGLFKIYQLKLTTK